MKYNFKKLTNCYNVLSTSEKENFNKYFCKFDRNNLDLKLQLVY